MISGYSNPMTTMEDMNVKNEQHTVTGRDAGVFIRKSPHTALVLYKDYERAITDNLKVWNAKQRRLASATNNNEQLYRVTNHEKSQDKFSFATMAGEVRNAIYGFALSGDFRSEPTGISPHLAYECVELLLTRTPDWCKAWVQLRSLNRQLRLEVDNFVKPLKSAGTMFGLGDICIGKTESMLRRPMVRDLITYISIDQSCLQLILKYYPTMLRRLPKLKEVVIKIPCMQNTVINCMDTDRSARISMWLVQREVRDAVAILREIKMLVQEGLMRIKHVQFSVQAKAFFPFGRALEIEGEIYGMKDLPFDLDLSIFPDEVYWEYTL